MKSYLDTMILYLHVWTRSKSCIHTLLHSTTRFQVCKDAVTCHTTL